MSDKAVLRTRFSRLYPVGAAVIGSLGAVAMVAQGGWPELWRSGPVLAFALSIVWALFWYPRVEVSDDGITVVNVVRTVWVPWANFRSAEPRWNLRVRADEREFTSWALPVSSSGLRRRPPAAREAAGRSPAQSPKRPMRSLLRGDTAEVAIREIDERIRLLTEAGALPAGAVGPVRVIVNRAPLLVMAVLAAVAVAALVTG